MVLFGKTKVAMPKRTEKNVDRKSTEKNVDRKKASSTRNSDLEWEDTDETVDVLSVAPIEPRTQNTPKRSKAPSMPEERFADCLCGEPNKEIQVMTGLNKHGYDVMKKLVKYLQKVIDVEEAYSGALKKLNDIDFPSIESVMRDKLNKFPKLKNGVNTAYQANKDVHVVKILEDNKKENLALKKKQDDYIKELKNIRNVFQKYIDSRQKYKDNLKKGLKKSINAKKDLVKEKEKLLKDRQKLSKKRDVLVVEIDKDPSKGSLLGAKLDTINKLIADNQDEEQKVIKKQEEAEKNLTKAMNDAAIKIYKGELARLELVYGKLEALCVLLKYQQSAATERAEKVSMNIRRGKPEIELEDFAKRYGGSLSPKA